jgi:predicted regulator of Ras-like GTPase activity (Roadblock/LC7/MglB family)
MAFADDGAPVQTLLVDEQGLVVDGTCIDAEGRDVGSLMAAQLAGVSDEAARAARHLALGQWRSILIETTVGVVGMTPVDGGAVTVAVAGRGVPLGMVRRVLARSAARAASLLGAEEGS